LAENEWRKVFASNWGTEDGESLRLLVGQTQSLSANERRCSRCPSDSSIYNDSRRSLGKQTPAIELAQAGFGFELLSRILSDWIQ